MESLECMNAPYCDDGTMPDDWPFKEWTETMEEAAMNANRPLQIANKLKKWYIDVGYVDVQEKVIKIPINSWPRDKHLKTLGKYWAENLLAGLQGFSLALFSRVFGWSKTEIEVCSTLSEMFLLLVIRLESLPCNQIYLVKIRKSITDHQVHAYTKVYMVWGRKPGAVPDPSNNATTSTGQINSHQVSANATFSTAPYDTPIPPSSGSAAETTTHSVPAAEDLDMTSYPVSEARPGGTTTPIPLNPATASTSHVATEAADIPLPSSPIGSPKQHTNENLNAWRMSI